MKISVQAEDFDLGAELDGMRKDRTDIGALVSFSGIVRDTDGALLNMTLEHYPGMTEQALTQIAKDAIARWNLLDALIIHRFGTLDPGAQIMMVAAASKHRGDAFEAASFMMDFLKSRAPFWKKEQTSEGGEWVDAREGDEAALKSWNT